MRTSKLSILACCLGVTGATLLATLVAAQDAPAASAPSSPDDQTKALEALRKAEAGPIVPDVFATTPGSAVAAPAPGASDGSHIVAPEPGVTGTSTAPTDEKRSLDALRAAESQPVTPDQNIAPAANPFAPPNKLMTVHDKEAWLIQIQEQRKIAEEKALADKAASEAAAQRQRQEDEAKIRDAIAAEKAANDQARADLAAQEVAAKSQQAQDDLRIQQAIEAEKTAAEQVRIAREEEAAAAERARIAKAQAEAAERARIARAQEEAARLKRQMEAAVVKPEETTPPPSSKEAKLNDLLRRYQADEITPYEYHVQRAKIVAEP